MNASIASRYYLVDETVLQMLCEWMHGELCPLVKLAVCLIHRSMEELMIITIKLHASQG